MDTEDKQTRISKLTWFGFGGAMIGLGVIGAYIAWPQLSLKTPADVTIVKAVDGPIKVKPLDAGGTTVAHQGLLVIDMLKNGTANSGGNNNTAMGSDARITFSGESTTDAGITFGGSYSLSAAAAVGDQGIYMSGDFGYVMMGAPDGVVDGMDTFMNSAANTEIGAGTTNSAAVNLNGSATLTDAATSAKVGYRSPEISGFQFGISSTDAGRTSKADNNQWIVTYDFGVAKVGYAQATIGAAAGTSAETNQKQMGVGTSFGDIGIKYATGTDTTKNAFSAETSKIDTNNWGLSYGGIENVTLYYDGVSSEQKTGSNAGDKLEGTTIGLNYTIAPGVSALVESGANDFTDNGNTTGNDQSNYTRLGLSVNF